MTITEILNEDLERTIEEAKKVSPLDYKRHWVVFPKDEIHYSKNHNRLYGYWAYEHREAVGAKYNDGTVVHHKDHDKHDNKKSNLVKISRSEHAIIDPNARKHEKCRICGEPHFSQGLCQKHYMQKFRHGKFGNYDKSKNYSKSERGSVLTEDNEYSYAAALHSTHIVSALKSNNPNNITNTGKTATNNYVSLNNRRYEMDKKLIQKGTNHPFASKEEFYNAVKKAYILTYPQERIDFNILKDACYDYFVRHSQK